MNNNNRLGSKLSKENKARPKSSGMFFCNHQTFVLNYKFDE